MNVKLLAARCALVASCGLMTVTPASAHFWQCVTFARSISGIDIHGNANTWWRQAAGEYQRGDAPRDGAVMAFASTSRMPLGHVAVVSKIINDREVLLTHANWSRRGKVERNVRAVDVSAAGDWSKVKVWYGPTHDLGTSVYAIKGFIYPGSDDAKAATTQAVMTADEKTSLANIIALAATRKF